MLNSAVIYFNLYELYTQVYGSVGKLDGASMSWHAGGSGSIHQVVLRSVLDGSAGRAVATAHLASTEITLDSG